MGVILRRRLGGEGSPRAPIRVILAVEDVRPVDPEPVPDLRAIVLPSCRAAELPSCRGVANDAVGWPSRGTPGDPRAV